MRRDLVLECTIAAVAGIGLAAVLTSSLGVRSSGSGDPLNSVAQTPAADVADVPAAAPSKVAPHQAPRKRHRHHSRRPARVATPSPPPVVAQAAPVATRKPASARPQRTAAPVQPVSAPAPAPVKPQSRPKPSGGGGVSFDDSG
jgi:hypothetical protein